MHRACSRRDASARVTAAIAAAAILLGTLALATLLAPPAAAAGLDGRCFTPAVRALPTGAGPGDGTAPGPADTPPPNPQVGDSWLWYIWRLNGPPQADLRMCTVRGIGPNCYVVVENSRWNVVVNQAKVDHIIARFEQESIGPHPDQGIYDINVAAFGTPPDRLDNDPRVYILYYDFDVNSDGFFWYFDEYPNGQFPYASNECEVLYLNDSGPDPAGDYMIGVLAHEFEHMIHFEHDEDEVSWVDEGLAEVAMYLYGHPDQVSTFNSNPDNNLTVFNGAWADYIKTYLWSLYFYERYGGEAALYQVVHEPANSTLGYDRVLDSRGYVEDFDDVFADWTVANYLDDTTIGDGRYGYVGEDLPVFNATNYSAYPVGPLNTTVNFWGTDYHRFTNATSGLGYSFDGNDLTTFAVWALELDAVLPTRVTRVPLSPAQAGTIDLPDVGPLYDSAVMVLAHNAGVGGTNYTYSAATGITAIAAGGAPGVTAPLLSAPSPNPFAPATAVRFALPAAGPVALRVYDVGGRAVRTLVDGPLAAGEHTAHWDGRDGAARELANGIYFLRLEAGGEERTVRAVLSR